ncbi:MAG: Tat pathway signal protein [Asticcacaulis sp.]
MNRRTLAVALTGIAVSLLLGTALPVHADEKKKGGGKGYTQFPMVTVFTSASSAHHGTLSVDLGLYSDDPKLQAQIKVYMPRLQDAYLSRLQAYASAMDSHTLADPDYISTQLQQATDRVLGHGGAKVLLGSVLLN